MTRLKPEYVLELCRKLKAEIDDGRMLVRRDASSF
jgi:hypothetical protein